MSQELVLVVDDEENIRRILSAMLESEGYEVATVATIAQAKEAFRTASVGVVLSDLKLEREDGLTLLKWIRDERYPCPVIILTAHGTVDSAVDAMKQGAFDYLTKPFERAELMEVIQKAMLTYRLQQSHSVQTIASTPTTFPMIGQSAKIVRIFGLIEKVAPADSTVLITGESGTGKELIAQAIHERSARANHPFIKINCAAIPDTLMESELFGHEKGSFTGAVSSKPGRFELADGGTFFLDEVGEMSTEMQVKLLRALQDRSFERVGGLRTIKVDVRLITATNKDLELEVRENRFRKDLFYRLNVVPINLPPLRERPDDIPRLIAYFLKKFSERMQKPMPLFNPETLQLLTQFPWPGNIRELENLMERLVVMGEHAVITPDQLPERIIEYEEQRFQESQAVSGSLKDRVKDATRRIEKKAIEAALTDTDFNVTQAARRLNISRKGLQLKMKELGIR